MTTDSFDPEVFPWGYRHQGLFVGKGRGSTGHTPLLVPPLEATESVCLAEAAGRVLAEDVRAAADVPAWPIASHDGYSLRSADTNDATPDRPVTLPFASMPTLPAFCGHEPSQPLPKGTRYPLNKLARLFEGSDSVVSDDAAEYVGQGLQRGQGAVRGPIAKGRGVVPAASECSAGDVVLHEGTRLRGSHVSLLAMAGLTHVRVTARPKVAVLAVHDYFKGPKSRPGSTWAHDAITPLVVSLLAQWGWPVGAVEHFETDEGRDFRGLGPLPLKPQIDALSATHDLVVAVGLSGMAVPYMESLVGISSARAISQMRAGSLVPVKNGWTHQGGEWTRPLGLGTVKRATPLRIREDEELLAPLLAMLEGWPASILASMYLQVRPVLHALEGHGLRREGPPSSFASKRAPAPGTGTAALPQMPRWLHGVTADPAPRHPYGPWLHLARFDGADAQGRQLLRVLPMFEWTIAAFARAEAMLVVGPGTEDLPAGSPVQFFLLD